MMDKPAPAVSSRSAKSPNFKKASSDELMETKLPIPELAATSISEASESAKNVADVPPIIFHTLSPKARGERIFNLRLLADGADGDAKKFIHLLKRMESFFNACVDQNQKLENIDARFREVIGLLHQVKHSAMKDAETIKNLQNDKIFRKTLCGKVHAQIEETECIITEIKIKIDENQKRSKELQQEKIVLELVLKNLDRSSAQMKIAGLEVEIEALKTRRDQLEALMQSRKLQLAPLIISRDNIVKMLREEMEETFQAVDLDDMEFGPKCRPVSEERKHQRLTASSASTSSISSSTSSSSSSSFTTADEEVDIMDEVIMMNFESQEKDDSDVLMLDASMNMSQTELEPTMEPACTDKSSESTVASHAEKAALEITASKTEEEVMMLSDEEHRDNDKLDLSNSSTSSGVVVVEENLLMSSEEEIDTNSVRRDKLNKSTPAPKVKLETSAEYIADNPDYDSMPLFPNSPRRIVPDCDAPKNPLLVSPSDSPPYLPDDGGFDLINFITEDDDAALPNQDPTPMETSDSISNQADSREVEVDMELIYKTLASMEGGHSSHGMDFNVTSTTDNAEAVTGEGIGIGIGTETQPESTTDRTAVLHPVDEQAGPCVAKAGRPGLQNPSDSDDYVNFEYSSDPDSDAD